MNPEYAKATPSAASSSTTSTSPASTLLYAMLPSACSDALTAEAGAAKLSFANSRFDIERGSQAGLRKIAKIVKDDCGNVVVEVGGHTDNTGAPEFNKTLSQFRAQAAVDFLIREGVDPAKLKAIGYGQEQPITTNGTAEGRRLNRRIEFKVSSP